MSEVRRSEITTDNPNGLLPGENLFAVFTVRLTGANVAFGLKLPQEMREAFRGMTAQSRSAAIDGLERLFTQLKNELDVRQ